MGPVFTSISLNLLQRVGWSYNTAQKNPTHCRGKKKVLENDRIFHQFMNTLWPQFSPVGMQNLVQSPPAFAAEASVAHTDLRLEIIWKLPQVELGKQYFRAASLVETVAQAGAHSNGTNDHLRELQSGRNEKKNNGNKP